LNLFLALHGPNHRFLLASPHYSYILCLICLLCLLAYASSDWWKRWYFTDMAKDFRKWCLPRSLAPEPINKVL
jgi:hypothetical protein